MKEAFRGKSGGGADPESVENLKIMFGRDDNEEKGEDSMEE